MVQQITSLFSQKNYRLEVIQSINLFHIPIMFLYKYNEYHKSDTRHQNPEILKFIKTMMYVSMTLNVTRRPWLETVYAAKSIILNYHPIN